MTQADPMHTPFSNASIVCAQFMSCHDPHQHSSDCSAWHALADRLASTLTSPASASSSLNACPSSTASSVDNAADILCPLSNPIPDLPVAANKNSSGLKVTADWLGARASDLGSQQRSTSIAMDSCVKHAAEPSVNIGLPQPCPAQKRSSQEHQQRLSLSKDVLALQHQVGWQRAGSLEPLANHTQLYGAGKLPEGTIEDKQQQHALSQFLMDLLERPTEPCTPLSGVPTNLPDGPTSQYRPAIGHQHYLEESVDIGQAIMPVHGSDSTVDQAVVPLGSSAAAVEGIGRTLGSISDDRAHLVLQHDDKPMDLMEVLQAYWAGHESSARGGSRAASLSADSAGQLSDDSADEAWGDPTQQVAQVTVFGDGPAAAPVLHVGVQGAREGPTIDLEGAEADGHAAPQPSCHSKGPLAAAAEGAAGQRLGSPVTVATCTVEHQGIGRPGEGPGDEDPPPGAAVVLCDEVDNSTKDDEIRGSYRAGSTVGDSAMIKTAGTGAAAAAADGARADNQSGSSKGPELTDKQLQLLESAWPLEFEQDPTTMEYVYRNTEEAFQVYLDTLQTRKRILFFSVIYFGVLFRGLFYYPYNWWTEDTIVGTMQLIYVPVFIAMATLPRRAWTWWVRRNFNITGIPIFVWWILPLSAMLAMYRQAEDGKSWVASAIHGFNNQIFNVGLTNGATYVWTRRAFFGTFLSTLHYIIYPSASLYTGPEWLWTAFFGGALFTLGALLWALQQVAKVERRHRSVFKAKCLGTRRQLLIDHGTLFAAT